MPLSAAEIKGSFLSFCSISLQCMITCPEQIFWKGARAIVRLTRVICLQHKSMERAMYLGGWMDAPKKKQRVRIAAELEIQKSFYQLKPHTV